MTDVKIENGQKGMLKAVQKYFSEIPPVFLDGCIAVNIAVLATMSMYFSTEEARAYIAPAVRFWLLLGVGCSLQGMHALSKFRDGTYGRHVEGKRLEAEEIKKEERRNNP